MATTIKDITDGIQKLADISIGTLKTSVESASKNITEMSKVMSSIGLPGFNLPSLKNSKDDCCVPQDECPPHCLLQITRNASAGERIIVPFMIKNKCGASKSYRVGVRELKSIDGSLAPSQPQLNKNNVTLNAGESESVLMELDVANFTNGNTYNAEIVIREKDINQNICFKLVIDGNSNVPVAEPVDEKKYRLHWQSWKSHYYCETPLKISPIAGQ